MLGFELRVEKWWKHGDSDKVEPFISDTNVCCICNCRWNEHGTVKRSGEILCPGSWVLKDYDDVIDEGELIAN